MLGRDGNISVIRVGVIAAVIGVVLIIGAVISFYVDRASHQVPLEIALYTGAVSNGQVVRSRTSRSQYYQIVGTTPEQVVAYYQQKLQEFYGTKDEQCVRQPLKGNFPEYDKGTPNIAPYQFSCMFDRSGFQSTQTTRVNIQPGIGKDGAGKTLVEYEQHWQS